MNCNCAAKGGGGAAAGGGGTAHDGDPGDFADAALEVLEGRRGGRLMLKLSRCHLGIELLQFPWELNCYLRAGSCASGKEEGGGGGGGPYRMLQL